MERPARPVQRHPRPGHFSIQGKRMHRLQPATATDAARDVWEKGRNDRNYDKAALFREKGPKQFRGGSVWWSVETRGREL